MVRPTARVLALLELLQGGGTHRVTTLAQRLSVDERTVRRYVEHLRDLDIAVESVRGRYGGYRLTRHSRMPPLMLSEEEALAVIWALQLTDQTGTGPASAPAALTAAAKVRRVLPAAASRRIAALMDGVEFPRADREANASTGSDHDGSSMRVLLDLAAATRERHPVTFDYTSWQGETTQRTVEPHGMVVHRGLIYLSGFDRMRGAVRTFRVDRIDCLQRREGTFTLPADVDPVARVLGPLPPAPHRHPISVRIRADLAHVRAHLPAALASVTPMEGDPDKDGWVRVDLHAERLEWVAGKLAVIDRPFLIDTPPALRDEVHQLAHRLLAVSRASSATDGNAG
jgi:predicted DNA-binding transcriptional regulator YafY